jgi:ABC-type Fe3+/spermidine/putrescine transport system ATPase subunit
VRRETRRSHFELRVDALSLYGGEVLAVLGPNGAGKTTLLRALAGLEPPAAGTIEGSAVGRVTMVFQRPVAFDGSVEHNVRVALLGRHLTPAATQRRVLDALSRFGIAGLARRRARRLSGGELRRLALARAFAVNPAVLLLDEPFDDLDAVAQECLVTDLRRAIAETDVAVAVVTHDLRRAVQVSDRMAVIDAGQLLQSGPTQEVLEQPLSTRAAQLVGMRNLIPGRVGRAMEEGLRCIEIDAEHELRARCELPEGTRVQVGIRAERLKIDVGRGAVAPIGKARVEELVSDGVITTIQLRWAGHELHTHLISGRGLARSLRAGDAVSISVHAEDVRVFPELA